MKTYFKLLLLLLIALPAGCRSSKAPPRPSAPYPRIVSYAPSLTELLVHMGLDAHIVGVTRYCPPLPGGERPLVAGDLQSINPEMIALAQPDVLLVRSKIEQYDGVRRLLPDLQIRHFDSDSIEDIRQTMLQLGQLVGRPEVGQQHLARLDARLDAVSQRVAGLARPRVLFCIDYQHPFAAGAGTYLHDMIELAGGTNAAGSYSGFMSLNAEHVLAVQPDVLICQVSPGQEQAAKTFWTSLSNLPAARAGRVFIVTDGGWTIPGPGVAQYAQVLAEMVHPSQEPAP